MSHSTRSSDSGAFGHAVITDHSGVISWNGQFNSNPIFIYLYVAYVSCKSHSLGAVPSLRLLLRRAILALRINYSLFPSRNTETVNLTFDENGELY